MMTVARSAIILTVYLIALIFVLDIPLAMLTAASSASAAGGVAFLAFLAWATYLVGKRFFYKNIYLKLIEEA